MATKKSEVDRKEEEDNLLGTKEELWEAMYIQACYWSFGASIVDEARSKFDEYIKKICGFILMQDTPTKLATAGKFNRKKLINTKK